MATTTVQTSGSSAISGAVNSAVTTAKNAATKAASGAASLTSALSSSLKSSVSASSSALSKLSGSAGALSASFNSSVSSLTNQLSSSGSGVLGSSLSSLGSKANEAMSSLFGQVNSAVSSLTSNKDLALKGPKEVADKLATLASDATAAISKPVSFITQPINAAISGTGTLAKGLTGVQDMLTGMGSDALSNIGKSLGTTINSSSDLKNAINSVTNNLASNLSGAVSGKLNSIANTVTGSLSSSVSGVVSSLTSGLNSVVSGITGDSKSGISGFLNSTLGSFTDGLSKGIQATTDRYLSDIKSKANQFLTKGITDITGKISVSNSNYSLTNSNAVVSSYDIPKVETADAVNALSTMSATTNSIVSISDDAVAAAAAATLDDTATQCATMVNDLGNTFDLNTITNTLVSIGLGSEYTAMINNATSNSAYAEVGDNNQTTVNALYKATQKIDGTITKPAEISTFRQSKNLFDVVLKISVDKGMTDLVTQMSKNTTYFDSRSKTVLKEALPTVATSGNPFMYGALVDILGVRNLPNNEQNLKVLCANLYTAESTTKQAYLNVLTKCNTSMTKLIATKTTLVDDTVLDATAVTLMTASDASAVQSAISSSQQQLLQSAVLLFANR